MKNFLNYFRYFIFIICIVYILLNFLILFELGISGINLITFLFMVFPGTLIMYFAWPNKQKRKSKTQSTADNQEKSHPNIIESEKDVNEKFIPHTNQYRNAYVSFDIETTGLTNQDKIIQIAAVIYDNDIEVDHFDSLVNPETTISQNITNLTGITNADIEKAPLIEDVMPQFIKFIRDYPLIGYNSTSFDIPRIRTFTGYDLSNRTHTDVLIMAKKSPIQLSQLKLGALKLYYAIDGLEHDALDDARTTAIVYQHLRDGDYTSRIGKKNETINFDGINFCISGNMSSGKKNIEDAITTRGGIIKTGMSKKVHYLIVGPQIATIDGGKSAKEKRFDELIAEGVDVKKITEQEFLNSI